MTTIGSDITPGPVTEVKSANFVGVLPSQPQDVTLVGPADLGTNAGQGSADAETVYSITSAQQARELFGDGSSLANNVMLALGQGLRSVYAIAPGATQVSGESLGTSTEGTFSESPVIEKSGEVAIDVDGTAQDVSISFDTSNASPASGEAVYNPNDGSYKLGTTPSTDATADYTSFSYDASLDEVNRTISGIVDFIAPLQEATAIVDKMQSVLGNMEGQYDFAIGLYGIGGQVDTSSYTSSRDDSRLQAYYPTRGHTGQSVMGAIAGVRGSIGLSESPMMKQLNGVSRMYDRINEGNMQELLDQQVNPIASRTNGARVIDDVTTVSDSNTTEEAFDTGFVRLAMDQVIETVKDNEQPFIGALNTEQTRNAVKGVIETQLKNLKRSQVIERFKVTPRELDARSVELEVNIETVKGLRNIYNVITAGMVEPQAEELDVQDGSEETVDDGTDDGGDGS